MNKEIYTEIKANFSSPLGAGGLTIDAKNVDFYYSEFHALKNINFEVNTLKITIALI